MKNATWGRVILITWFTLQESFHHEKKNNNNNNKKNTFKLLIKTSVKPVQTSGAEQVTLEKFQTLIYFHTVNMAVKKKKKGERHLLWVILAPSHTRADNGQTVNQQRFRLIVNLWVLAEQICSVSSFSNVSVCYSSVFQVILNWVSSDFGLWIGQNKTPEDFTFLRTALFLHKRPNDQ